MIVFGTRPEAIKLAPVILEMRKKSWLFPVVCATGQHREMLDQMMRSFDIVPDLDLGVMTRRQSLHAVTARILTRIRETLLEVKPDLVMVQGDTTTTFSVSLAAFYEELPVAHVEAGLRTFNSFEPFPEEMNRKLTDCLSSFHFAATETNRRNLLREGVPADRIYVVGNTIVDALKKIIKYNRRQSTFPELPDLAGKRIIAVTAHRRESFGQPLEQICHALLKILQLNDSVEIIYPVHLNPNVSIPVRKILGRNKRIHLLPPLDYFSFVELLSRSELILTDSGGVQEEAPTLRKPVLLLRNVTERPEGVDAGFVRIVGTDVDKIVDAAQDILNNSVRLSSAPNPYGDGRSAWRIVNIIRRHRNELLANKKSSS